MGAGKLAGRCAGDGWVSTKATPSWARSWKSRATAGRLIRPSPPAFQRNHPILTMKRFAWPEAWYSHAGDGVQFDVWDAHDGLAFDRSPLTTTQLCSGIGLVATAVVVSLAAALPFTTAGAYGKTAEQCSDDGFAGGAPNYWRGVTYSMAASTSGTVVYEARDDIFVQPSAWCYRS